MSQKKFPPIVLQEEIIEEVIETKLEEEFQLVSSFTEVVSPNQQVNITTKNNNTNDINYYLELLDQWNKLALAELKLLLEDYAGTTKQFQILQSYNPKSPPNWLVINYGTDPAYDEDDEYYSKFEALKKKFLREAVDLDIKATQKKLVFLSTYLKDPTTILHRVYTTSIGPKVLSLPSNLKESWESAKKRCEYAYSQAATSLLEEKLTEIEKIAKENVTTMNNNFTPPSLANNKKHIITTTNNSNNNNGNNNNSIANNQKRIITNHSSSLPSTPTKFNNNNNSNNSNTNNNTTTPTKDLNMKKNIHSAPNSPHASHLSHSSPGHRTTPMNSSSNSPIIDPNDKHRPSTRGRSKGRQGNEDISKMMDSLSNL